MTPSSHWLNGQSTDSLSQGPWVRFWLILFFTFLYLPHTTGHSYHLHRTCSWQQQLQHVWTLTCHSWLQNLCLSLLLGAPSSTTSGAGTCHTLPTHHCTCWTCTSLVQTRSSPKLGWFFRSNYWKNFLSGHFERVLTASQCRKIQNRHDHRYYGFLEASLASKF